MYFGLNRYGSFLLIELYSYISIVKKKKHILWIKHSSSAEESIGKYLIKMDGLMHESHFTFVH